MQYVVKAPQAATKGAEYRVSWTVPPGSGATLGKTDVGTTTGTATTRPTRTLATEDGTGHTYTHLNFYSGAIPGTPQAAIGAVYADNGAGNDTLEVQTVELGAVTPSAWNQVDLATPWASDPDTDYWLGVQSAAGAGTNDRWTPSYDLTGASHKINPDDAYYGEGNWPATYTNAPDGTRVYAIYLSGQELDPNLAKGAQYVVRSTTTVQSGAQYAVLATHSAATKADTYAVRTTPGAVTAGMAYMVAPALGVQKSAKYTVVAPAAAVTRSAGYRVDISPAAGTKAAQYAVLTQPAPTKGLTYSLAGAGPSTVTLQRTCRYVLDVVTTTYYVDKDHPSASDGNAGTDPAAPWATIQHACEVAGAGDRVRIVKAATPYTEDLNNRGCIVKNSGSISGDTINRLAFVGDDPDNKPVIDNSPSTNDGAAFFVSSYWTSGDYITFADLEIQGARLGLHFEDNGNYDYCRVERVDFHDIYSQPTGNNAAAIRANTAHHLVADGCTFDNIRSGGATGPFEHCVLSYTGRDIEVKNSVATNCQALMFQKRAPDTGRGSNVHHNTVHDAGRVIQLWIQDGGSAPHHDIDCHHNVAWNVEALIFTSASELSEPPTMENVRLYNNTTDALGSGGRSVVDLDGTAGVEVYDNIFYQPGSILYETTRESGGGDNSIAEIEYADYNLFYNPPTSPFARLNTNFNPVSYTTLTSWQAAPVQTGLAYANPDANSVEGDPLFQDQPSRNYNLQAGSPAIGAGRFGGDLGAIPFAGTPPTTTVQLGATYTVVTSATGLTPSAQYAVLTTPAAATKGAGYAVTTQVPVTKGLAYEVLGPTKALKTLTYRVQTTPTAPTKATVYHVATVPSAATKAATYRVSATRPLLGKTARYTVVGEAPSVQTTLTYAVAAAQVVQKGLMYEVGTAGSFSITKSLRYAVSPATGLTKSTQYVLVGETWVEEAPLSGSWTEESAL